MAKKKVSSKVKEPSVVVAGKQHSGLKLFFTVLSIAIIIFVLAVFMFKAVKQGPADKAKTDSTQQQVTQASNDSASAAATATKTSCPSKYNPVCGADNKTYSNKCYAEKAGVNVGTAGACKKTSTTDKGSSDDSHDDSIVCSDSDDGKSQFVKGTVTVDSGGISDESDVDVCVSEDQVREFFCSGEDIRSEIMECGTESTCEDGRCIPTDCHDTDGHDIFVEGETVKGDDSFVDVCDGPDVREYFCADDGIESVVLPCPEDHVCDGGECEPMPEEHSEPCTETDAGREPDVKGTTTKDATSETDSCVDSTKVKEWYCHDDDVEFDNIMCETGDECVDGKCQAIAGSSTTQTCTDTDSGQDFATKGTVTVAYSTGGSSISDDYCDVPDNKLVENYCDGDTQKSVTTACSAGKYCNDGACGTEPTCNDPDAGSNDVYTVTTVTKGTQSQQDYCQWDQPRILNEATCSGNKILLVQKTCPAGMWCDSSHKCETEPACTETDSGKDYTTSGTTTKGTYSNTDYCMGNDLKEFYCDSTGLFKEELYTCPSGCSGAKCN
jgi:hypothetical protein